MNSDLARVFPQHQVTEREEGARAAPAKFELSSG